MRFVNAIKLHRNSGGAKPRDLRFCGPLLEIRNDKGEVGVSRRIRAMIGGGCGTVGAGHTNGAPQIHRLGMTRKGQWFIRSGY
jgi:hypothetical protein